MVETGQHGSVGVSGWSWLVGAFACAIMLAGTFWLYRSLSSDELAAIERSLGTITALIQADLHTRTGEQLQIQERMALRLAQDDVSDEIGWRNDARNLLAHYPFYRALVVLDTDLAIRWLETTGLIEIDADGLLPKGSGEQHAVLDSAATGTIYIAPPHLLSDSRPGINVFTPIGSDQSHRGFLVAIFDLPDVIGSMIGRVSPSEVIIRAYAGDSLVYPAEAGSARPTESPQETFHVDLDDDGRGIEFFVSMSPRAVSQMRTVLPEVTLVTGILLSLLLATALALAMGTIAQARVLALSNRRLEREMRDRKLAEKELEYLATHDPLTGASNRAGFTRHVENLLEKIHDHDRIFALLYIDLDNFKEINDRLGHIAGDEFLCRVAGGLGELITEREIIGRFGGDEFVVAAQRENREQIENLARAILVCLGDGFDLEGSRVSMTASIGIACYPDGGRTVNELIRSSDAALFKAKESGRNQFVRFSPELYAEVEDRLNLSREIHKAMESGKFELAYQPVFDLADLSVHGLEALARWPDKSGIHVTPRYFIRVSEESGSIHRLSRYVLRHALADLARWQQIVDTPPWLSVNISGELFRQSGLVEQIRSDLDQLDIRPELVHLEITEGVLIENLTSNRKMLQQLVDLGMPILIDDFGVGFASILHLKDIPVSAVKISKEFISGMLSSREDMLITRTLCTLARELGLTLIAKGIEREEQLELLRGFGCQLGQGFLFSSPVEANSVDAALRGDRSWSELRIQSGSE